MVNNINKMMRTLHRNIGYFFVGFIIIYSLSGITQIFRDTDFLKTERTIQKECPPNMSADKLTAFLDKKDLKVIDERNNVIRFNDGNYNKVTGIVIYKDKEIVWPINEFMDLHKAKSKSSMSWIGVVFGIMLLFMAVSSFWMFKPKTKQFKRGVILSASGFIVAIIILLLKN